MDRVAIFVDAGYLFAQGSVALSGSKKPRSHLALDEKAVLAELMEVADLKTGGLPLLRVYWYDGMGYKGQSAEQALLASTENFKVRLGIVNSQGQQKGVDSLIVTDLIDLARHRAMTDAVLMSGDEDIRIGVQVAQGYGIRAHLVGITPSRGSQSRLLLQEADSTFEMDKATVEKFLSIRPASISGRDAAFEQSGPVSTNFPLTAEPAVSGPNPPNIDPVLDGVVDELISSLIETDIAGIKAYSATQRGVPSEFDGKLLARSRAELGRDLEVLERRYLRMKFTAEIRRRS